VDQLLEEVGLSSVAHRRAGGFSLGMAQRLGLAAALLGEPRALLLDEPANGLDPQGVAWLRQLLRAQAASGRAVLVSSHLLAEMQLLADHVLVRSPDADRLAELLVGRGATVKRSGPDELTVLGMELMEMVDTPGLQHERRPCERAAAGQDGQAAPGDPAPR
jgi:ABC-2 type transport system ATP-binding protein